MIISTAVLLVFLCEVSLAQDYVDITRKHQDEFEMCLKPSTKCSNMDATSLGNSNDCSCKCSIDKKNVFGFLNDKWKCHRNSDVRAHAGCSVIYISLNTKRSPITLVSPLNQNYYVGDVNLHSSNCKVQNQLSYLDCNGAWKQMDNMGSFWLERSGPYYELYDYDPNSYDQLHGRIIKLNIECKSSTYCVLLKVQGKQKCAITRQPSSSTLPSTVTPTLSPPPTSSSPPFPSSTIIMTTMSTVVAPTSSSSQIIQPGPKTIDSTMVQPSLQTKEFTITKSTKTTPTREPFLKDGKKRATTVDSTGIIGGAVGGVVALLVVLVVVLIIRKIKLKRNATSETMLPVQNSENIYEQPIDNSSRNTSQQPSSQNQYEYAHSSRQYPPPISEASIYNTINDPGDIEPEPVYNVLEGPGTEGTSNEAPFYDVPERPGTEGTSNEAPFYDVLVGPEPDDNNVYRSLKRQESHIYGSLIPPNSVKAPANGESTYGVVERGVSDGCPVYDVLENPEDGQRLNNSLNFSTIAAKDLQNPGYDHVSHSTNDGIPLSESKNISKN